MTVLHFCGHILGSDLLSLSNFKIRVIRISNVDVLGNILFFSMVFNHTGPRLLLDYFPDC